MTPQGTIVFAGFDGVGVILAFTAFVAVSLVFGFEVAGATLAALFIYELGQWLARRSLGMGRTELKMLPFSVLSRGITKRELADDPLADCYVALMGAGLSLAPMVLSFALAHFLMPFSNYFGTMALTFAVTIGAVNAIMMLPFAPLDGGRCLRAFSDSFWPALSPALTCFLIAAFASASMRGGSLAFLVLAGIGLQSLLPRRQKVVRPLSPNNALIVLAAYSFTLAAHFCGGWWLIKDVM